MLVILFGVIGVMFGYMILGMMMSSLLVFGIIVVVGVVVNDLLVMVDFVNKVCVEGVVIKEVVM